MKFTSVSFIFVFLFCFVLLFCSSPQKEEVDLDQVRKVIEEQEHKFIEAALQGDAVAAAALCTEDTFLLPSNSEIIQGRQETEAFWEAAWAQLKVLEFDISIVDLYGSGNVVYEIGKYTVKF